MAGENFSQKTNVQPIEALKATCAAVMIHSEIFWFAVAAQKSPKTFGCELFYPRESQTVALLVYSFEAEDTTNSID